MYSIAAVNGCRHRWRRRPWGAARGGAGLALVSCSRPGGWLTSAVVLLLVSCSLLSVEVTASASAAATATCSEEDVRPEDCCQHRMQQCWQLYETAQEQLGVPDHLHPHQQPQYRLRTHQQGGREAPAPPAPSSAEQSALCLAFRTYYICLKNISCTIGDLAYHAAASIAEKTMTKINCSRTGPVYRPRTGGGGHHGHGPHGSRLSQPQQCPYMGARSYHYCALFGDPHLRTYDGGFQTCRVSGAWPLIDNEHFTIQVTSEPIGSSHLITALAQVTVMLKKNEECGSAEFVTYEAQRTSHLPLTFDDGRAHLGPQRSISIHRHPCSSGGNDHQHPRGSAYGECVELYLRHIDTTIILRRIAGYLSVAVHLPRSVANSSSNSGSSSSYGNVHADERLSSGIQQLCMVGCPRGERFSVDEFVHHKHGRLKMHVSDAAELCAHSGATDGFFDACVEDLLLTGSEELAQSATVAQSDMLRLYQDAWASLRNRTSHRPLASVTPPSYHHNRRMGSEYATSSATVLHGNLRTLLAVALTLQLTVCYWFLCSMRFPHR